MIINAAVRPLRGRFHLLIIQPPVAPGAIHREALGASVLTMICVLTVAIGGMAVLCNEWIKQPAFNNSGFGGESCLFREVFSSMLVFLQDILLERTVNPDLNAISPPPEGSK